MSDPGGTAVVTLWRSVKKGDESFGFGTNWTTSKRSAVEEWGGRSLAFGGTELFTVDIQPANLLDLRVADPWRVFLDATGVDEADFPAGELGHELIYDRRQFMASIGFDWYAHWPFGRFRDDWVMDRDIWVYLGDGPLDPRPAAAG